LPQDYKSCGAGFFILIKDTIFYSCLANAETAVNKSPAFRLINHTQNPEQYPLKSIVLAINAGFFFFYKIGSAEVKFPPINIYGYYPEKFNIQ